MDTVAFIGGYPANGSRGRQVAEQKAGRVG